MDLQLIVAVNVAAISLLLLAQMLAASIWARRWMGDSGMALANVAVLASFALALELFPDDVGTVVTAVAVPLVLAPLSLGMLSVRRSKQMRHQASARFARLAAVLHPTRAYRFNAAVARAWALGGTDETASALHALARTVPPWQAVLLEASAARALDDWAGVVTLIGDRGDHPQDTAALLVRALGELGRIDDMAAAYARLNRFVAAPLLPDCQLFTMACAGREDATRHLLATWCRDLSEESKAYWRALAALRGARRDAAPMTELLAAAREASTRRAAARHLAAAPAAPPSDQARFRLDTIEDLVRRIRLVVGRGWRQVPATWTLLVLIAIAFAVETMQGGSESIETLVRLGAVWPPFVLRDGEWWRLGAALLLHFGPLHLIANALNLWVLGRLVEAKLGSLRAFAAFWLGGLASSAGVLWLMHEGYVQRGVLVGASGAIMALLGVIVARQAALLARHRDGLEGRRLAGLVMIVAVQVAADMLVPQVSFAAHACGFLAGLAIGAAMMVMPRQDAQRRARTTAPPRS